MDRIQERVLEAARTGHVYKNHDGVLVVGQRITGPAYQEYWKVIRDLLSSKMLRAYDSPGATMYCLSPRR